MYYVYILASQKNGTLYIGVTNSLERRMWEHRAHLNSECFTDRYGVQKLVYYDLVSDIHEAIRREKQLKHWDRKWKLHLIESVNPEWKDLSP
jgi:putative endonuclease